MKKRILLDASSAILLYKTGLINIVTNEYVMVTSQSVYSELTAYIREGSEYFKSLFELKKFIISYEYKSCLLNIPLQGGERDTVLLFLSGEGEFVLIDDKKGGTFCKKTIFPISTPFFCLGYYGWRVKSMINAGMIILHVWLLSVDTQRPSGNSPGSVPVIFCTVFIHKL